jgi:acyl-[acyl carrier protein]--UDP-N-acetylglucosamine O-acyltransferase
MSNESDWLLFNGNKIHKTSILLENVIIGSGNIIYPYSVIGFPGFIRDISKKIKSVIIGDNNHIGMHVSIMAGEEKDTIIGDENLIMNYVNIGHDVFVGNKNEIGARTTLAGFSKIGNLNKIKLSCTLRNRKIIGNSNIIGMCSNITESFFENNLMIYGNPAKIIRKIK